MKSSDISEMSWQTNHKPGYLQYLISFAKAWDAKEPWIINSYGLTASIPFTGKSIETTVYIPTRTKDWKDVKCVGDFWNTAMRFEIKSISDVHRAISLTNKALRERNSDFDKINKNFRMKQSADLVKLLKVCKNGSMINPSDVEEVLESAKEILLARGDVR